MNKTVSIALGVIVLVLIIAGAFVVLSGSSSPSSTATTTVATGSGPTTTVGTSSPSTYSRPVMLTDPPQAPSGTSAIVVAYSSVMVQDSASGSGWVAAQGSGNVDLMSTVNSSQIIAYANVTANSQISAAEFTVVSAYAIVNGTTYNVTVPNSQIVAQVSGQTSVNQNSSILVDMTPTLSAVYSQNTTAFVLVPSATAVVVDTNASSNAQVGSTVGLSLNAQASLQAAAPSIQITSASVAAGADNSTTISVTVMDNSSVPVTLSTLGVYGPQQVTSRVNTNSSTGGTTSGGIVGVLGNLNANVNVSASVQAALVVGVNLAAFQASSFVVGSSGSLVVPSGTATFASNSGVTVSPGQTATLTYSGQLNYNSDLYTTSPVSGSSYRIVVVGQGNAVASTTVNAQ